MAPATSSQRRYRLPCFDIPPSLSLPPVECCLGTKPIHAARLRPDANAWGANVIWGSSATDAGGTVILGTTCSAKACDNTVWNASSEDDTVVWGTSNEERNIVWGTTCGGADCNSVVWGVNCTTEECASTVWSTSGSKDNIAWGTSAQDEGDIVWETRPDIAGIADVNRSAPCRSASMTLPPPARFRSTC